MPEQRPLAGGEHSGRATDERAALVLVGNDEGIRNYVGAELRKRYGADYRISIHDDRKDAWVHSRA